VTDDPTGIGPPPRLDLADVERLRAALDEARRLLDRLLEERTSRSTGLAGWHGGHRQRHDRREQDARELGTDLDAALRQQRSRLDDEVARLVALRHARGGPAARAGWTARTRLPCLLGR